MDIEVNQRTQEELQHLLREGWRRHLTARFANNRRREAAEIRAHDDGLKCNERVLKTLKSWWRRGDWSTNEVTTGGMVSVMVERKMQDGIAIQARKRAAAKARAHAAQGGRAEGAGGEDEDEAEEEEALRGGLPQGRGDGPAADLRCPFCGVGPATHAHTVWGCGMRPPPIAPPKHPLQSRLARPLTGERRYDDAVLNHLRQMRLMLVDRWREDGEGGQAPERAGRRSGAAPGGAARDDGV